jgi:hypothetical protein
LEEIEHSFDKVKEKTKKFLAKTRDEFPRFYFHNDATILDLVSQPPMQVITTDISSCFNFTKVTCSKNKVLALHSKHGETLYCPVD